MPPTANRQTPSASPQDTRISGKWIIVGVLAVALTGAGTSWWFRYHATHRTAQFWGPNTVQLIRDASRVATHDPPRDVSAAKGLVHLRNALLEDRSFNWPAKPTTADIQWQHGLLFHSEITRNDVLIMFAADFRWVCVPNAKVMLSCEPISTGLHQMFAEFADLPPLQAAAPVAEPVAPKAPQ